MNTVVVFTDGACQGNPGPGGWAAILQYNNTEKMVSGYEPQTTNNRMELTAAVEALRVLKRKCLVEIYTDSQYVKQGMSAWIFNWRRNGWRTADKKPIKNQDLWMALDELSQNHEVQWNWVKGHAGHPMNERVDQLAKEALCFGLEQTS
ncbi:MAG: ribonuclease [Pseudomonadota bacterium]|nr:ribonuclease [Pseudomonadota bacterium]